MLLFAAFPAFAQYGSPVGKTDVQSILSAPDDARRVILQGTIVRNNGDESYLFTDGTGQVNLAIEDRLLWGQKLDKGTKIEIEGEMDEGWFSDKIYFSVERVQVIEKDSAAAVIPGSGG